MSFLNKVTGLQLYYKETPKADIALFFRIAFYRTPLVAASDSFNSLRNGETRSACR